MLGPKGPRGFASAAASPHHAPDHALALAHLALDLHIDVAKRTLRGTARHTLRAAADGAQSLRLDAVDFTELSLTSDGATLHYDGAVALVRFERALSAGDDATIELRFAVEAPKAGVLFLGLEGDRDAPLLAASDHETERARHWLPTIDHPSARPTLAVKLTTDAAFDHLCVGAELRNAIEGAHRISEWRLDVPCPSYLTCFAVGAFRRWSGEASLGEGRQPIELAAFVARDSERDPERSFAPTASMIAWMEAKLQSPLRVPKYHQFGVPFIGGAMENISLVSWDERYLLDEALEAERRPLMDIINLHELAHSWFGNDVGCRDHSHAWLKESWATYMESCWLEDTVSADEGVYDRYSAAARYFEECRTKYVRPVATRRFDHSWLLFDRHLYPGGAFRLHMLRRLVGDEAFWTATRRYLETHSGGVAETVDLRRAFERTSGRSLTLFFDNWITSRAHPRLSLTFEHDGEGEGTFRVTREDWADGDGLFDVRLPITWWIDGEAHAGVVDVGRRGGELRALMSAIPTRIAVDPEQTLLHELTLKLRRPMLLAMLAEGPLSARIDAAKTLAADGSDPALRALANTYVEEPHWGLRVEIAKALSACHSAGPTLAELCAADTDPRTMALLFEAAGKHRSAALRSVLRRRLDGMLPPIAAGAAAEALGAQRNPDDLERLVSLTKEGHEEARAGALRGLGRSTLETASHALRACLEPGAQRSRLRAVAIQALGALLPWLSEVPRKRALAGLEQRLADPIASLRRVAANALVDAGARESAGTLERFRRSLDDQHAAELDLSRLREKSPNAATKRIEELEARLQKLERSMDTQE
ncbi:MAG: M1 family metallopeptidase [Myxococcota bacterium]